MFQNIHMNKSSQYYDFLSMIIEINQGGDFEY